MAGGFSLGWPGSGGRRFTLTHLGVLTVPAGGGTGAGRTVVDPGAWHDLKVTLVSVGERGEATYPIAVVNLAAWAWWGQALLLIGGVLLLRPVPLAAAAGPGRQAERTAAGLTRAGEA